MPAKEGESRGGSDGEVHLKRKPRKVPGGSTQKKSRLTILGLRKNLKV